MRMYCYYTESHNVAAVTPIAVAWLIKLAMYCASGSTGSEPTRFQEMLQ
jgi:hypothetical protein